MSSWIHTAAARRPERVAIEYGERTITYAELSRLAAGAAHSLAHHGAGAGARVALELEDRFAFAVALHGCLLNASPAVPIDLRLSQEERARRRARAELVVGEWPLAGARVLTPVSARVTASMVATVMHTSGTTSAPKPVELTYGNWLANAFGSAIVLGLDVDERWLCPMPLAHVGGLSILIRSTIYATTVILHERFETEAVLRELMDPAQRITLVSLVPTMLARLLDAGLESPPTLRWVLLGGGPISPALLERAGAAGVPVAPSYGMTEACSQIATFGFPLPGVELRISDGEVMVRGPIVSPAAADSEGWLRTGDLGRFDARGRLQIIGRGSDTIISGGENVSPSEVEDVLLEHPAVADAAVHARPDPEWGEAIVATVVIRDGASISPEELRRFCAARLARFKVPKAVELTRELPRTPSGKLLRGALD
ncbi:MAG: class I adenylate-forming enzyme family protein [Solirubrobacteraceae bacterium]